MHKFSLVVGILLVVGIGGSLLSRNRSTDLIHDESPTGSVALSREARDRLREMQSEIDALRGQIANLEKTVGQLAEMAAVVSANAPRLLAENGFSAAGAAPDQPPVPANEVMAVRPIVQISVEEMAQRIERARNRTSEPLTPVTPADLASMVNTYEWGTGEGRRMFRLVDGNAYQEVYPDGRYSVFPILGRAVVNDMPGVIAMKDDGSLDVFIPDKGNKMVHLVRGASGQSRWFEYQPMQNVE